MVEFISRRALCGNTTDSQVVLCSYKRREIIPPALVYIPDFVLR